MPLDCALHKLFQSIFFLSPLVRQDGCIRLVLGTGILQRHCGVGSYHCDRLNILMKKPHEFFLTSQCIRKVYCCIILFNSIDLLDLMGLENMINIYTSACIFHWHAHLHMYTETCSCAHTMIRPDVSHQPQYSARVAAWTHQDRNAPASPYTRCVGTQAGTPRGHRDMTGCWAAAWIEVHKDEPLLETPASRHTRERLDTAPTQKRTCDSLGVATHSSYRDRRNHVETPEPVSRPLQSSTRDHTTCGPLSWTRVPPRPDPRPGRPPAWRHNAYRAPPACRDRKPHRGQTLSAAARTLLQPTTPGYRTPSCVVT